MGKTVTYRIIALFMAFYLPLTLVGIPLHKHYCEGELASFNVFLEAESCHEAGQAEKTPDCCSSVGACHADVPESDCSTGDCCDNEVEILKVDLAVILNKEAGQSDQDLEVQEFSTSLFQVIGHNPVHAVAWGPSQLFNPFPESRQRLISQGKFIC